MDNDLARLLGDNIRAQRKVLGITQEALASRLELSTPYVNLLEAGKKFPSEETLGKLIALFGIRPYQLFTDPLVDSVSPDATSHAVSQDFIKKLTSVVETFAADYRKKLP